MPYDELADFIAELRGQEGIASRALEFLILTAARTGEVIGARWDEIDLGEKMWVVPAARMKAGREHRVPLSAAVAGILEEMKKIRESDFVFPGGKKGKPLSNVAMLAVLKRIGRSDLTSHGIRSSFRDWAAERTNFPARGRRDGAGAHRRRQGRGRLPPRRPVPEASSADGCLGEVLRNDEAAGGGCADRQPRLSWIFRTPKGGKTRVRCECFSRP